jgi:hypothetical protein
MKSVWFRQVFGLLRVPFRQVFGLLRVPFRQISLYYILFLKMVFFLPTAAFTYRLTFNITVIFFPILSDQCNSFHNRSTFVVSMFMISDKLSIRSAI